MRVTARSRWVEPAPPCTGPRDRRRAKRTHPSNHNGCRPGSSRGKSLPCRRPRRSTGSPGRAHRYLVPPGTALTPGCISSQDRRWSRHRGRCRPRCLGEAERTGRRGRSRGSGRSARPGPLDHTARPPPRWAGRWALPRPDRPAGAHRHRRSVHRTPRPAGPLRRRCWRRPGRSRGESRRCCPRHR